MAGPTFQALTVKSKGIADRLITSIRVSQAFDLASPPDPLPAALETTALWDTGATKSVISDQVAKALGLVPVGKANVRHAGGTSASPTYLVNFTLPNHVVLGGALVTEFGQLEGGFGAIVGMDVITLGDFSITNVAGQTWMTFRTPSCIAIDYVADFNRLQFAGVGRNEPCPCGKHNDQGKPVKFKHCHGG